MQPNIPQQGQQGLDQNQAMANAQMQGVQRPQQPPLPAPAQMSPAQSALQAAMANIQQQSPQMQAQGQIAGAAPQSIMGAAGQAGGQLAQALQGDPRYQTAIQHIGNFLTMLGHPLANAFNQYHGLTPGQGAAAGGAIGQMMQGAGQPQQQGGGK